MTTTPRTAPPFARGTTAILALAAMLATMVTLASPAAAHARLEASSPKDGSTLTATPPEIMLRFNEPIKDGLNQVSVKSGSTDVTDGDLEIEANTVYQPIKSSLKSGSYTVTYKVVSADGHPISGSLSFTYAPPGGDTGAGDDGSSETTTSGGGATSDSPSSSATTPPPPSESTTSASTSTSAPSSSTSEPSSTSTSSSSGSSSTSGDGETEPSGEGSSTSSDTAAPVEGADTSSSGGFPAWGWAAIIGAVLVVLAGIGLALRGRRDTEENEHVDLEEWRG